MHEQAENENERPFSFKRERRQSKGYQDLIQKEPVTKSPFRQRTPSAEEQPPTPSLHGHLDPRISVPSVSSSLTASTHTFYTNSHVSPGRSSLVSKRMHGPRGSNIGRRERRKTVTFDERCDVVEFDREEETDEEVVLPDAEEGVDDCDMESESDTDFREGSDPLFCKDDTNVGEQSERRADNQSSDSLQLPDMTTDGPSLLELALDPDTSISGIVDEMFASSRAGVPSIPRKLESPPPETHQAPIDMASIPQSMDDTNFPVFEMAAGTHSGRSHAIQFFQRQESQSPLALPHFSPSSNQHDRSPSGLSNPGSPLGTPLSDHPTTTIAKNSPLSADQSLEDSLHFSTPPLARSIDDEGNKKPKEHNWDNKDTSTLPSTPSKSSRKSVVRSEYDAEGLDTRFEKTATEGQWIQHSQSTTSSSMSLGVTPRPGGEDDPFSVANPDDSKTRQKRDTGTSVNLSIGAPNGLQVPGNHGRVGCILLDASFAESVLRVGSRRRNHMC